MSAFFVKLKWMFLFCGDSETLASSNLRLYFSLDSQDYCAHLYQAGRRGKDLQGASEMFLWVGLGSGLHYSHSHSRGWSWVSYMAIFFKNFNFNFNFFFYMAIFMCKLDWQMESSCVPRKIRKWVWWRASQVLLWITVAKLKTEV